MKITPDLLEAHLKCPTKGWLCAAAAPPTGNEYADWVKTQTATYSATAMERLRAQTPPADCALSPPADNLKVVRWRLATEVIARAELHLPPRSSGRESAPSSSQESQSRLTSAETQGGNAHLSLSSVSRKFRRMALAPETYRYIVATPDVRGGHARLEGTRIGVHDVIGLLQNGETVDSVPLCFPGVTRAQVYECLAYYEDHRAEIDHQIATQMAAAPA